MCWVFFFLLSWCLFFQLHQGDNSNASSVCFSASSGSDSPDQALEAEEIVKQLDMEQTVETPTSTDTSMQEVCATSTFYSSVSQLPPLRSPHIPEVSPVAVEGELDADLPPLTGRYCSWDHMTLKESRVLLYAQLIMKHESCYFMFPFLICGSSRLQPRYGICRCSSHYGTTGGILWGRLGSLRPVSNILRFWHSQFCSETPPNRILDQNVNTLKKAGQWDILHRSEMRKEQNTCQRHFRSLLAIIVFEWTNWIVTSTVTVQSTVVNSCVLLFLAQTRAGKSISM